MKRSLALIALAAGLGMLPAAAQTGPGTGPGGWGPGNWGMGNWGMGNWGMGNWGPGNWGHGGWWGGPGMMQGQGYGMGMMGGPGGGCCQDPNAPGRGRFAAIDANEDGSVSDEEAASHADMVFSAMDADDNGALTLEEFLAVRMGPGFGFDPARQEARQKDKSDRFAAIDSDADGSVTKAEFLAAAQAHFASADADGDGKVTPWEMRRANWN